MTEKVQRNEVGDFDPVSLDYACRLLLSATIHPPLLARRNRPEDSIAEIIGWEPDAVGSASSSDLREAIKQRLRQVRYKAALNLRLIDNIQIVKNELSLTELEAEILMFVSLVKFDELLTPLASCIQIRSRNYLTKILSEVLCRHPTEVREAISANSRLVQSGLLTVSNHIRHCDLEDVVTANESLCESLMQADMSVDAMYKHFSRPSPAPQVQLDDYTHLTTECGFMLDLLKAAANNKVAGVNVLLYGPPGTGKTQLARALCDKACLRAVETLDQDDDQDVLSASGRLSNYALGQRLMGRSTNTAIIFDEVEEILDSHESLSLNLFGTPKKKASQQKSWKNRLLEENAIPAIWIANNVDRVDDALLRRFTYTLKIDVPPRSVRRKMADKTLGDFALDDSLLNEIADQPMLTPADLERTAKAISLASPETDDRDARVRLALNGRYNGVRVKRARKKGAFIEMPYDASWIRTTPDIESIAEMLSYRQEGRLLCSGPPGTGKTAFITYLARKMDVPLLKKKASDLLSPYVGMTEIQMMRAFDEATSDGAFLFIDEADSFLRDRRGASRGWEVSQVNELLTQIDGHEGYLALATNFNDRLDSALARRIDLKIDFQRLDSVKGLEAITEAGKALGIDPGSIRSRVKKDRLPIHELALGDIAAAVRQAQLRNLNPDAQLLVSALFKELEARNDFNTKPIGFVH